MVTTPATETNRPPNRDKTLATSNDPPKPFDCSGGLAAFRFFLTREHRELIASRPYLWVYELYIVSTAVSGVLPVFQKQATEKEDCLMCCPSTKKSSKKFFKKFFLLSEGYTKTNYATLYKQRHRPNNKMVHQTSLLHIESNPGRLGLEEKYERI